MCVSPSVLHMYTVHAVCNNSIEPEVNSCRSRRRHDDDMTKQVNGGAEDPQIQEPFFGLVRSRRKPIVIPEGQLNKTPAYKYASC
jgi:hypothetical protein